MRLGASSAVDDRGPRLSRGWMGELIFAFVGCWPVWGPGAVEWSCPAPSGSREGWDTLRCDRASSGSREEWDTLRWTKCAEGGSGVLPCVVARWEHMISALPVEGWLAEESGGELGSVCESVGGGGISDMLLPVGHGPFAGCKCLDVHAEHGDHGQAAVLQFLQLQFG